MNKRILKIFSSLAALFAAALNLPSQNIPNSKYAGKLDPRPVKLPPFYAAQKNELRGIWVATIFNIDYQRPQNVNDFKKFYSSMCRNLAANGFNAIFFQVRPANDAFYRSKLNPWSQFLSGTEGMPLAGDRNFDPLRYMINEAHRHGLSFHAWLNPYRVCNATKLSKKQYLNTLAKNNFARLHPELVLESKLPDGQVKLVLDPGSPEVRGFVLATVMEIVRNYPVESIHFDDYFYPDDLPAGADRSSYLRYNPRKLALDDWRRSNVTTLVSNVHYQIGQFNRQNKRNVLFGISPFGIWRNKKSTPNGSLTDGRESYSSHYADTRLWVKQRMIDYIVPQIYWNFGHDSAAYAALTDWWCATVRGTGVKLYTGNAVYQLGKKGWQVNELYYQLRYNRSKPEISGAILFSYRSIAAPENKTILQGGRITLQRLWSIKKP